MRVQTAIIALLIALAGACANSPSLTAGAPSGLHWKSPARLGQRFKGVRGTIEIGTHGISFHPFKGKTLVWSLADIQSFYVTPHQLRIRSYENRGWKLPGEKAYRFDLSQAVPPAVAAALAAAVGKPSRNADPDPRRRALAVIPARHTALTGGSNGLLRFSDSGIDYLTHSAGDSRAWRWADIETLARPDLYHFRVGGYNETYDFELKRPMSQALFDRLWVYQYGRGLQLGVRIGGSENRSGLARTGMDDER